MVQQLKRQSKELLKRIAQKLLPVMILQWISTQLKSAVSEPQVSEPQVSEPLLLIRGWERYAREWKPDALPPQVLPSRHVQHLGDEWTGERGAHSEEQAYGLPSDVVANFEAYMNQQLLNSYLPPYAIEGLEIGPGGGRLTTLLVPRTKVLHVAEPSKAMLRHLKQRFAGVSNLRYYHTDGMTLPALRSASLDYVFAFDVFIHFEPRLIYWYLRQVADLLKPGGIGIVHYSNVLTQIGWHSFEDQLAANVQGRSSYGSFGVMCPQLMTKFLEALGLEVVRADVELIPRDAISVFRKPVKQPL